MERVSHSGESLSLLLGVCNLNQQPLIQLCCAGKVEGKHLAHTDRKPENNLYVRIPHRLLKAVPDHVEERSSRVFLCVMACA